MDPEGTKVGNSDRLVEEEARWQHCAARSLGSSHSPALKDKGIARGLVTKVIETCQNKTADSEESAAAIFSIRKHGVMLRLDCINN